MPDPRCSIVVPHQPHDLADAYVEGRRQMTEVLLSLGLDPADYSIEVDQSAPLDRIGLVATRKAPAPSPEPEAVIDPEPEGEAPLTFEEIRRRGVADHWTETEILDALTRDDRGRWVPRKVGRAWNAVGLLAPPSWLTEGTIAASPVPSLTGWIRRQAARVAAWPRGRLAGSWLVHNVVAHPLLAVWPRAGEWLHDLTAPTEAESPVEEAETVAPVSMHVGPLNLGPLNIGGALTRPGLSRAQVAAALQETDRARYRR